MNCKFDWHYPFRANEMEVLRNIQAAGYNIELAYQKTVQWVTWKQTAFPIKITTEMEKLIVIPSGLTRLELWICLFLWKGP